MHNQLKNQPNLKASILLDYTRGTREDQNGQSSKTILMPLLKENDKNKIDDKILINFFLSPDFSNLLLQKTLLKRQKYNEIISLQHIKIYLFDDDFIISGANLNEQYFTNRQDRYVYIRNCPQLADYLERLIQAIGNISMHLNSNGTFDYELNPLDEQNKKTIQLRLKNQIEQLNKDYLMNENKLNKDQIHNRTMLNDEKSNNDTIIYPLIQMKKFNINTDKTFTKYIFNNLTNTSKLYLASGYFNLTKEYQQTIFRTVSKIPNCSIELIMASEQVNSFYKAKGPIQHIPSVYTQLSKNFLYNLNSKMLNNVKLLSYFRPSWTFHAKGLWLQESTSDYFLSLIGSPNFGYRSVYKDLELQLAIFTKDDNLIVQFLDEYENIKKYSTLINNPDELPTVSYWIRIVTKFIKSYF